ncbi:MAG: acyl-CoA thioesterase [Acidisphaera sp.]|nr:acyl-CoA thioesterase [Acidisphaera sp.]
MSDTNHFTQRASFTSWTRETCRYGDTDRQGHINNAVFATFCESGRVALLAEGADTPGPPGCAFVIVRLVIDFRAELLWGDVVDIGTAVVRVGKSSLALAQGLFRGEQCVATSESVLVLMDETTRRATPLPPALRASLAGAG